MNHPDWQRSLKWLLKISPSLSLLTQNKVCQTQRQLWLHCQWYLHANYLLVFWDYLMNSGGKVVPLRKIKLPQKFMAKEKHESLPARARTADVLTHPAFSIQAQTTGSSSVLLPRIWLLISHPLDEEVPWRGQAAAAGADCPDLTVPAQLGIPTSNGTERFQFRLRISLFFPQVIKATFSLPSVGFFEVAIEWSVNSPISSRKQSKTTACFPEQNQKKLKMPTLAKNSLPLQALVTWILLKENNIL